MEKIVYGGFERQHERMEAEWRGLAKTVDAEVVNDRHHIRTEDEFEAVGGEQPPQNQGKSNL
jgi:hypothetical protein